MSSKSIAAAILGIRIPYMKTLASVFAALVIVGYPVASFFYWPEVLRAGLLPHDGDSIAIPMIGSFFSALTFSPIIIIATVMCCRGHKHPARLFDWNRNKPITSTLTTLALGVLPVFLTVHLIYSLTQNWDWFEYIWTPYQAILIGWFVLLRSGVMARISNDTADSA